MYRHCPVKWNFPIGENNKLSSSKHARSCSIRQIEHRKYHLDRTLNISTEITVNGFWNSIIVTLQVASLHVIKWIICNYPIKLGIPHFLYYLLNGVKCNMHVHVRKRYDVNDMNVDWWTVGRTQVLWLGAPSA